MKLGVFLFLALCIFIQIIHVSCKFRLKSGDEQCIVTASGMTTSESEYTVDYDQLYTIMELEESTGARCLDGTNYKFFYNKGSGSGADKFMIYWEGGAFCGTDGLEFFASCLERSSIILGSSKTYTTGEEKNFTFPLGFLSNNQNDNPDFWNWNKIYIAYCDGSNHQGYLEEPVEVEGQKLWFRGYNNTKAVLKYAQENLGLFESSKIILSGSSAGAQAFYIWANYLQNNYFPENIQLYGIADSGLFLDRYNPKTKCNYFRYLNQKLSENTNSVNLDLFKNCAYAGRRDVYKCMFPENIINSINFPVFVINSQFDQQALSSQIGVNCSFELNTCNSTEKNTIESFRREVLSIIKKQTAKKKWGFWIRSCNEHVLMIGKAWYTQTKNVYSEKLETSMSLRDALSYWYNDGEIQENAIFVDPMEWNDNSSCR